MLKNFLLVAWRNIRKQPVFSVINIAGLAVGLAAFWLIALYIGDELSYDRYHANAPRIYRVAQHASWKESSFHLAVTSAPFAPVLKGEYPEIEEAVRVSTEGGGSITVGDKSLRVDNILFTDPSFCTVFSQEFIAGNRTGALQEPQSIVLTETIARNLFGNAASAIDKTVYFDNKFPNKVTGIIRDVPVNTHLGFQALRSLPKDYTGEWQQSELYTYILLRKGSHAKNLEAKLPAFYKKHLEPSMGRGISYRMELQPLTSIHLHSRLEYEAGANGSIQYVYIFAVIGLLVLIIASINYMNLSTARASYRVKEIGVRKVIGSGKKQLVFMFLAESVLICLFAGVLALVVAQFALPLFNQVAGKELALWRFGMPLTLLSLFSFTIIAGLLSGMYPAFFMSGFMMIPSLKGQIGSRAGTVLFRKALVTFQFVITIIMIAASYIVYQQLTYVQHKNLGLNKDQVLTFHIDNRELRSKVPAIRQALMSSPLVEGVGSAGNPIGNNNIGSNAFSFEENATDAGGSGSISSSPRKALTFAVDGNYIPTLEIALIAGRNFSEERPADRTGSVIVNETLVKELGWKNAIGKRVQYKGQDGKTLESQVIGVVKDFHIYSLQHKLQPLVLQMPPMDEDKDNLYVRVNMKDVPAALTWIKDTYRQFDSGGNPVFHFLSENFNAQYEREQKQGTLLLTLTVLAISIACLGLFGLVTYTALQKSKEIGIRKVLGASVAGIVRLLSVDLMKLVVIAFVIATPIAWVAMQYWLQEFAYQVNISLVVFVVAGATAMLIALVTIGVQAVRSATANPVKTLKVE